MFHAGDLRFRAVYVVVRMKNGVEEMRLVYDLNRGPSFKDVKITPQNCTLIHARIRIEALSPHSHRYLLCIEKPLANYRKLSLYFSLHRHQPVSYHSLDTSPTSSPNLLSASNSPGAASLPSHSVTCFFHVSSLPYLEMSTNQSFMAPSSLLHKKL